MTRYPNQWVPADEEILRELWQQGYSGQAISEKFGGRYSRSAVGGKANRMGLPSRQKIAVPNGNQPKRKHRKKQTTATTSTTMAAMEAAEQIARAATEMSLEEVPVTAVTLYDVEHDQCRWPFGHPRSEQFRVCGAPRDERSRFWYCTKHAHLATHQGPRHVRPRRKHWDGPR